MGRIHLAVYRLAGPRLFGTNLSMSRVRSVVGTRSACMYFIVLNIDLDLGSPVEDKEPRPSLQGDRQKRTIGRVFVGSKSQEAINRSEL